MIALSDQCPWPLGELLAEGKAVMAAEKSSAYDRTAAAAAIVTARRRARGQRAEAEPDSEAPAAMRAWLKRAMGGAVRPADLQDGGKVPAAEKLGRFESRCQLSFYQERRGGRWGPGKFVLTRRMLNLCKLAPFGG
jgi:hypothetical protein